MAPISTPSNLVLCAKLARIGIVFGLFCVYNSNKYIIIVKGINQLFSVGSKKPSKSGKNTILCFWFVLLGRFLEAFYSCLYYCIWRICKGARIGSNADLVWLRNCKEKIGLPKAPNCEFSNKKNCTIGILGFRPWNALLGSRVSGWAGILELNLSSTFWKTATSTLHSRYNRPYFWKVFSSKWFFKIFFFFQN